MDFIKSLFTYYIKNIIPMLILSLIPAIYFVFLLKPFQIVNFLWNYQSLELNGFADFFYAIFAIDWLKILFFVIGIFILTAFLSIILGKIESHFRTGKFRYSLKSTEINSNFLSVLIAVCLAFFSYFIIMLLAMLFMLLAHFIVVINNLPLLVGQIICVILTVLAYILYTWVIGILSVTCVDMAIMGSPLNVAISNASNALHKKLFKNYLGICIPLLIGVIFSVIGCAFGLELIFNTLSLLIILPWICIFAIIKIFEHYDIARYDTRPYYNLK